MEKKIINIFCDGSCNKKKEGGWSVIELTEDYKRTGTDSQTTNNRMELMGMIGALDHGISRFNDDVGTISHIVIYSDSQYVVRGINEWFEKWSVNQFRTIENPDLWLMIAQRIKVIQNHQLPIVVKWVKGHDKSEGNIAADKAAVEAREKEFSLS